MKSRVKMGSLLQENNRVSYSWWLNTAAKEIKSSSHCIIVQNKCCDWFNCPLHCNYFDFTNKTTYFLVTQLYKKRSLSYLFYANLFSSISSHDFNSQYLRRRESNLGLRGIKRFLFVHWTKVVVSKWKSTHSFRKIR